MIVWENKTRPREIVNDRIQVLRSWKNVMELTNNVRNESTKSDNKWRRPDNGWILVLVDVVVFPKSSAYGVIKHDLRGCFLEALVMNF